ncbi:hypothetical protein GZH47_31650 (plasmid) [Paenibacillus rhizovicinus]|uniref:Uncharacterized protein n=1 Tax=Paenibacillus rhizovicinus TaxID=2704463 RepID=A0A6C0PA52_9BACL|nr:hypothetical protein [Paenibacillus rhizovicinus]QHW35454.1 hypothetical protein GZH47_31650 [Paenibacillus rhizovicinus]
MSKNRKVILASVGVLLALIVAVLMIRDPAPKVKQATPPKIETPAPTQKPAPVTTDKDMDDSHQVVAGIIDDASNVVSEKAPGVWKRMVDYWNWLMEFDAKYAIILIVVGVVVVGVIVNGNNASKGKRKQH